MAWYDELAGIPADTGWDFGLDMGNVPITYNPPLETNWNPLDWMKYPANGLSDYLGYLTGWGTEQGSIFHRARNQYGQREPSIFDRTTASVPVLSAIDYAKSQSPFDTSRQQSIFNSYGPTASTAGYDLNTRYGLDRLQSGLRSRGLEGSAFGQFDIDNYNLTRNAGRGALVNDSAEAAATAARKMLGADVASRELKNDLYGRSIYTLSNVWGR